MKVNATAIICAYNEEKTIRNILKEICDLILFSEVIIINDGSTDDTSNIILELKKTINIRDVHLPKNLGKGFAMAKGVEMASSEYIVFIDADLSNYTRNHALKLLNPVITGKADMVMGQATNTLIPPIINPFKKLSGQRAMRRRELLPILEKMKTVRFGAETLINMHFKTNNKMVNYVTLHNLVHPTKFHKTKPHIAIKEFILEGWQIIATASSYFNMNARLHKNRIHTFLVSTIKS